MSNREWQPLKGDAYHAAALSGRPVLVFGTPRYGPTVTRHGIAYFETGKGWREDYDRPFTPTHWMPLPPPPKACPPTESE